MSDQLSQAQDGLDDLATHLYATIYYASNSASPASIPGQPFQPGSKTEDPSATASGSASAAASSPPPSATPAPPASVAASGQLSDVPTVPGRPSPAQFNAQLQQLAAQLVAKERKLEQMLLALPGAERSPTQQEQRLRELNDEVKAVAEQWADANARREALRGRVEDAIMRTTRV